jgi:hypothetical protein
MTTTSRQNNLILNQDWKRIYQTFKNADFKSYDFENLRRVIITYLRENYPEDFNDYIESSEYLALIDAVAFLGQSLAFRTDLASRENFLELAETKESVLRLARLISYNSRRNIPAQGLLKFDTISTTEGILDSNNKNLASQTIIWNDSTNSNWFEQFVLIMNSAMADNTEFGRSQGTDVIQGIHSEQYRFRSNFSDVPIFNFEKVVASRRMAFELVSTSFNGAEDYYEEAPVPGAQLGFIYRQDGKGNASSNTGFFMLLKQGSLELTDFSIDVPTTNEVVSIDVAGINDSDVWMFGVNSNGSQGASWTKVSSITGNNIAYNSINSNVRNIYSVITKEDDKIDLVFADGTYGNLPQGAFKTYYRVSNGLSYTVSPAEMRSINISVPYINAQGVQHELLISCSLKYTISTATASEDINSIKARAPAIYYTQNRMITGEDYNLAPLSSSQDILKVKAINRTSSGISRNFDVIDASGKYSSVNVFADDGIIYKEDTERIESFKYTNRIDIINYIRNNIEPLLTNTEVYNFYLTKFTKIQFTDSNTLWTQITNDVNSSTGYFINNIDKSLFKVGTYTTNSLKYIFTGALVKFVPPTGKAFKRGSIVDIDSTDVEQTDRIWVKVVKITGDGTNAGRGILANGLGPIVFNDVVPTGAIAQRIVPRFINNLPTALENEMANLISLNINFGLRYEASESSWKIITSANIDLLSDFSLGRAGDVTNSNLDSSWIIAFIRQADSYNVRIKGLDYIFRSLEQNRFYFDVNQKTFDRKTGKTIKDQVKVLGINADNGLINALKNDFAFEVSDAIKFEDGYQSSNEIKLSFADSDDDGVADNPESFEQIVGQDLDLKYLFFYKTADVSGYTTYNYIDNSKDTILIKQTESGITISDYSNGQLIYFYASDENRIKRVDLTTNTLVIEPDYKPVIGRPNLKFQYIHNANIDRRIDPSVSNIIDVYLLTRTYDTEFRKYVSGAVSTMPEAPTSDALRIAFGGQLDLIKSISDELIYHPVNYKILFGSTADTKLQAQFKVVKNPSKTINDNDLKVRIVTAINSFFDINNWDFGDRFYLGELITYVTNEVAPDVSNLVIVPRQPNQTFGSLFEIQGQPEEIFISGATVDDVVIVPAITAVEIRATANSIINSTQ